MPVYDFADVLDLNDMMREEFDREQAAINKAKGRG